MRLSITGSLPPSDHHRSPTPGGSRARDRPQASSGTTLEMSPHPAGVGTATLPYSGRIRARDRNSPRSLVCPGLLELAPSDPVGGASLHAHVRFVIALTSNDGAMRFRLLKAIRSEL